MTNIYFSFARGRYDVFSSTLVTRFNINFKCLCKFSSSTPASRFIGPRSLYLYKIITYIHSIFKKNKNIYIYIARRGNPYQFIKPSYIHYPRWHLRSVAFLNGRIERMYIHLPIMLRVIWDLPTENFREDHHQ